MYKELELFVFTVDFRNKLS